MYHVRKRSALIISDLSISEHYLNILRLACAINMIGDGICNHQLIL